MKLKTLFVILEKKKGGNIYTTPFVEFSPEKGKEYIKKVRWCLSQMRPLFRGELSAEDYPRRTLYSFNSPCRLCDYALLCLEGTIEGFSFQERKNYEIPYLSPTSLLQYETCPRQWAYNYSGIRPEKESARKYLGFIVHRAIESYCMYDTPCEEVFTEGWDQLDDADLVYSGRETHKSLREIGQNITQQFPLWWKEYIKNTGILAFTTERQGYRDYGEFRLSGRADLVCFTSKEKIIIDFKVAQNAPDALWLQWSDQVLAYCLLEEEEQKDIDVLRVYSEDTQKWVYVVKDEETRNALRSKVKDVIYTTEEVRYLQQVQEIFNASIISILGVKDANSEIATACAGAGGNRRIQRR